MTNYYVVLIGAVIANLLVALYNTFNKEKVMIQEGGAPLPISSYVFLVVKYALWALAVGLTDILSFTQPQSQWGLLLFTISIVVSTYIVATILEVLVRVVIHYIWKKKLQRDVANIKNKQDKTGKDK